MNLRRLNRPQKIFLGLMCLVLLAAVSLLLLLIARPGIEPAKPISPVASPTRRPIEPSLPPPTRGTEPPAETVTPQFTPSPTAAPVSSDVRLVRRIAALGEKLSAIRALPWRRELAFDLLQDDEMTDYVRELIQVDTQAQQQLWAALDLLPRQNRPLDAHSRARIVVSFYAPGEDRIVIGSRGRNSEEIDPSFIQQYAHALQDQHFALADLAQGAPNADAARARDALVEGDATLVTALVVHHNTLIQDPDQLTYNFGLVAEALQDLDDLASRLNQVELTDYESYPSSLAMHPILEFPYREGTLFTFALLQSDWWAAVNAAYNDPPVSTEQILHPAKYIANPRDLPQTVTLPDLSQVLGEGWEAVAQSVLGELVLRAHLDQYLDAAEAAEAAAGWDGDLAALWRNLEEPRREVLIIRATWDNQSEANQFATGYTELVRKRLGETQPVIRSIAPSGSRWWRGQTGEAYLFRQGTSTLIIWAPDTETMESLLLFLYGAGQE